MKHESLLDRLMEQPLAEARKKHAKKHARRVSEREENLAHEKPPFILSWQSWTHGSKTVMCKS